MSKITNIVDKHDNLIASISDDNIILHKDYYVVETYNGEPIRPEVTI